MDSWVRDDPGTAVGFSAAGLELGFDQREEDT